MDRNKDETQKCAVSRWGGAGLGCRWNGTRMTLSTTLSCFSSALFNLETVSTWMGARAHSQPQENRVSAGNWSQRLGKHHSLISFNTLSQSSLTSKMIRMSLFHFGEFPLCLKQSGAWKPLMCRQCLEKRGSFVLRKGLALLWPEERKQDQRPHQNRSLRRSPCFRLRYKTNTQGRMKSLKMPTTCLLKN